MPGHRAQYRSPFGPIEFSPDEENELRDVANTFIERNLAEYEYFLGAGNSTLDAKQWEVVKEKDNVKVYNDRTKHGNELTTTLTYGLLKGSLDDFQYGANCPSTGLYLVKSVYIEDRVADCCTLSLIDGPTPEDPFNSLCVRWFVKGQHLIARAIAKNRDMVYIECSRMITLKNGERVGVLLLHSIAFPQAPPLNYAIRGNISLCGFSRQVAPDCIETYVKCQVDGGNAPRKLVVISLAEVALTTSKYMHTALMKKLAWSLRRENLEHAKTNIPGAPHATMCAVCSTKFSTLTRSARTCALCRQSICTSCRVKKTLASFLMDQNDLTTMTFSFCVLCLNRVGNMNATDIYRDELMMQDAHLGFGRPSRWSGLQSSSAGSDE